MQGLSTGNFSFQVRVVDAARNEGEATPNYIFVVNKSLQEDGAPTAAYWGLGWKFWLIIAAGASLCSLGRHYLNLPAF